MTDVTSEARPLIGDLQQIAPADLNALGLLAQGSLDSVVLSFLAGRLVYSGLTVAADTVATRVVVAPGRLYDGSASGKGFALRDPFTVDLGTKIAAVPADKSALVAILAQGQDLAGERETRTFLDAAKEPTNPADLWPTVTLATDTRQVRSIVISSPAGDADVQPEMPSFGASLCLIATVTINANGIVRIVQNPDARIRGLTALDDAARTLELWRALTDPKLVGLLSTVSALALQVGINFPAIFAELARLDAAIKDLASRFTSGGGGGGAQVALRGADYFNDESQSAPGAAGYNARIAQGLRFPAGAVANLAITPQNLYQAGLRVIAGCLTPFYTEVQGARSLAVEPFGGYSAKFPFNELAPVNGTLVTRGLGVTRMRWSSYLVAVGASQLLLNADPSDLFNVGGVGDLVYDQAWGDWRATGPELSHGQGYWRDSTGRGFWTRIEGSEAIAGVPAFAQAISGAGAEMICALDVNLFKLGTDGDLRVLLCDDINGNPDLSRVYADVTVGSNSLVYGVNRVRMPFPILRQAGKTLHALLATNGPHYLGCLSATDGSNTPGALGGPVRAFQGGQWVILPGLKELGLGVVRASFGGSGGVLRVPCAPLTLAGGIDAVDIVNPGIVPAGCDVSYETVIGGVVVPLGEVTGPHPLAGRPTTLPLTMVVRFTEAAAPILAYSANVGEGGYAQVSRSGTALKHISATRTPTVSVTKIVQVETIDQWNGAKHTLTARLQTGAGFATETPPDAVSDESLPNGGLRRTWTWLPSAGVADHRVAVTGATSDPTAAFVGRQADWYATAS